MKLVVTTCNSDKSTLDRLKKGDLHAFETLFKRYYKLLCLQAFYILDDEQESEDVVQLLFSEIWEKQLFNNINSSLKAYLQTAVRNRCLKLLDRQKTEQKRIDNYLYSVDRIEEIDEDLQQDSENSINSALKGLPRQRQQAFTLVYIEEKKYKETALEMGISVNSVKSHLRLAVKELREKLIFYR